MEPLANYLQDHLAGARFAVELVDTLRRRHQRDSLGHFFAALLSEIQADVGALGALAEKLGDGASPLKEVSGWLLEKLNRIKLDDRGRTGFVTFEALELLQLGIRGKRALWDALEKLARSDPRLLGPDYFTLIARARAQEQRVDQERLMLVPQAFAAAR